MKKIICLICAIAAIVALFAPATASAAKAKNTSKKYATKITEEGITQNLQKESQKRWYTFTTEKDGDAIIIFDNTADTVYSYYWYMTVYKKDGKTVVKEGNVEGGGKTTCIALEGLEAGKYYICIARSSGGNPFMVGYTDAEYTINLITADTQRPEMAEEKPEDDKAESSKNEAGAPEGNKDSGEKVEQGRVLLIEKKNAVLCSLEGKLFVKENEGAAMVAYYTNKSGQTGPILVGETKEAVKYYSSNAGEGEFEYGIIKYDDKQYYYSCAWRFVPGVITDTLTPAVYKCSAEETMAASYAARELLNVYFGKDPKDGFTKAAVIGFIEQYWFGLAIGVIVLIVIIVKIVEAIRDNSSSYSSSYRSSSYSGSSYSSSSYSGGSYSGSSYGGSSSSYDDYGISKPAYDYNHVTVGEQDYRVYGSGSSQYYEDAEGYKHSTEGMDVQAPFNWLDL